VKPFVTAVAMLACVAVAQAATFTTLYSFQGSPDGAMPQAGAVADTGGNLYGTTYAGGSNNDGTVFELFPPSSSGEAWTETILYSFQGTPDGFNPIGALTFGASGVLFGTTVRGGSGTNAGGTVFELTPPSTPGATWTETILHSFKGGGNHGVAAGAPSGALLMTPAGRLFGTTGGSCLLAIRQPSTAFELVPPAASGGAWTEFPIYNFQLASGVGCAPVDGVISQGGALYGTSAFGGSFNDCSFGSCGTAYELTPPATPGSTWTGTALHTFTGPPDGALPHGPLTPGPGGVFYGSTGEGGAGSACVTDHVSRGCGAIFQLTPPATPGGAWTETILYSFTGASGDGAKPQGSMVLAANGSLYGTTVDGGGAGEGVVFELSPPTVPGGAWTETVQHRFSGADGSTPNGLTHGPGGVLYGTTQGGGTHGAGTVFSITP